MLRIFHNTTYDFIRWWKVALGLTAAFIVLGIGSLLIKGVNYSIDFTGGTLMQIHFTHPPNAGQIRAALDGAGFRDAEIQQFGSDSDFTLRVQGLSEVASQAAGAERISQQVDSVLIQRFGSDNVNIVRTEAVGPRVGSELRRNAVLAI